MQIQQQFLKTKIVHITKKKIDIINCIKKYNKTNKTLKYRIKLKLTN